MVKDNNTTDEMIKDSLPEKHKDWWCKVENGFINNLKGEKKNKIPFVNDEKILGNWKAVGFVAYDKAETFTTDDFKKGADYPLTELTFNPGGDLLVEFNKHVFKESWTNGFIIFNQEEYACKYMIREIEGEQYLFFEWKSGDYGYGGQIPGGYVLKKV